MAVPKAVLALLLSLFSTALASTSFETSGSYCNGFFSLTDFSTNCQEGACGFGKEVKVEGSVYASSELPEDVDITVKACLVGMCKTIYSDSTDLCGAGFEAQDGQECPEAGSYSYDTSFELPGDDGYEWFSSMSGYSITVTATFTGSSGSSSECGVTLKAVSGYNMSYTAAALVGLVVAAGGATYGLRRRRLATHEEEQEAAGFEMMNDRIRFGTTV